LSLVLGFRLWIYVLGLGFEFNKRNNFPGKNQILRSYTLYILPIKYASLLAQTV